MSQEVLVGVDVGTTSIKALCVTLSGEILSIASRETPWRHAGPLADADPRVLAEDRDRRVRGGRAAWRGGRVRVAAIGVTGIAEAGVLIDARGEPCAPALAWFDPRGDAASVRAAVAPRDFQRATGRRLNSKPSLMKVLWLRGNVPAATTAVRHLCVAEWIVRALGGEEVSEASLASRTGMLDVTRVSRGRWPWSSSATCSRHSASGRVTLRARPRRDACPDGPARGAPHGGRARPPGGRARLRSGSGWSALRLDGDGRGAHPHRLGHPAARPDRMADRPGHRRRLVGAPDHQILLAGRLTGLSLERVAAMLGATDRESRRLLGEAALGAERGADAPRLVEVGNDALTLGGITDGITPGLTWRCVVEDLTAMSGVALEQMATVAGPHTSAVLAEDGPAIRWLPMRRPVSSAPIRSSTCRSPARWGRIPRRGGRRLASRPRGLPTWLAE